ncbi:MAG: hypothetical protein JWN28_317 [Candidatus Saccharibacteria bacterium]|nr:hypothetical protein [Candidatus Saccharibacteria bacterium]
MSILSNFAQSSQYYSNGNSSLTEAEAVAIAGTILVASVIIMFFTLIIYVVLSFCMMQIFKKAGVKPWIAWVPFYNTWKMLEIGGQPGYWSALSIIPIVNIVSAVYIWIAMYHIGKKLGKDDAFIVLGVFLPIVWYIWLAVDKSKWNDKASTARSLAR